MKARVFAPLSGLALLLLAAFLIAPGALAQIPTSTTLTTPATAQNGNGNGNGYGSGYGTRNGGGMMNGANSSMRGGVGYGMGMMGSNSSLVDVAAGQLRITRAELVAALGGTKSISQVAAEHNVAASTIVDAFLAPRAERLDAMVTAGTLTREQADQMLATMRTQVTEQINAVWSPQGAGPGTGFVDKNGDGICDNMPTGAGVGTGNGNRNGMPGTGRGPSR